MLHQLFHSHTVTCLQECHGDAHSMKAELSKFHSLGYGIFCNPGVNQGTGGSAIVCKPELMAMAVAQPIHEVFVPGRIHRVLLEFEQGETLVIWNLHLERISIHDSRRVCEAILGDNRRVAAAPHLHFGALMGDLNMARQDEKRFHIDVIPACGARADNPAPE
eukprot:416302-Karenia_brevis.AAC.1